MIGPVEESPFLKEVRSAFDGLLHRGVLTINSSVFDEEAFGNAVVVLAGQYFHLRLVRDRGDVFADVRSSASPEWKPLERVLRAVGVASVLAEGLLSVEQAARLIEGHISALESGLTPGSLAETGRALRKLDAEAAKRVEERWRAGGKNKD